MSTAMFLGTWYDYYTSRCDHCHQMHRLYITFVDIYKNDGSV